MSVVEHDRPSVSTGSASPVLELDNLVVEFQTRNGTVRAADGVSYAVREGETLCVVGESGCGKSASALAILGLIPNPPGRIAGGRVMFDGTDLTRADDARIRAIRGNEISMIFQEPMTSLNPMMKVGVQIMEPLVRHKGLSGNKARSVARDMLERVRIPDAARWLDGYPHEMSGGMRQRVMIAMALICDPAVLIADEPTTALDVTIQAQILDLMRDLQQARSAAVVLITHDLGVVAETADRVAIMYAGRVVEQAGIAELFKSPMHPYTVGLMQAIPRLDRITPGRHDARLEEIPGTVPPLNNLPEGCAFTDRCPLATDRCRDHKPPYEEKAPGHWAACWEAQA